MIWRTHLCKVFADVLSSVAQIMTERTGITSLTGTLTEELARNVGRIYDSVRVSRDDIWYSRFGGGRVQHGTTTQQSNNG